jgi:hypothetical protein
MARLREASGSSGQKESGAGILAQLNALYPIALVPDYFAGARPGGFHAVLG